MAPTDELRKWFGHDEDRWSEFRKRYLGELKNLREEARSLAKRSRSASMTLVYAAKDEEHNNSVVLKQYLEMFRADGK